MLEDRVFLDFIDKKYESWKTELGKSIEEGRIGFEDLEKYALENGITPNISGRQELLESILNQYIYNN